MQTISAQVEAFQVGKSTEDVSVDDMKMVVTHI